MDDPCERDGYVLFWNGWPSNWHPAPFVLDGVTYSCCEQYMMAEKARTFGDRATLAKILEATAPKQHKALGRQVTPYDDRRWQAVSRNVVYRANLAKYQQHPELAELLLATGSQTIAEASPRDLLWGIGLDAADRDATRPSAWPGKNWLGQVLMQVRNTLRSG